MRRGGRILIVLGLLLGAITAVGTFIVLGSSTPTTAPISMRPVVVAQQNIPERAEITSDAVAIQQWPESAVPVGAVSSTDGVVGKIALQPIYQGQIILPPMIVAKGQLGQSRTNASLIIPDGKVAMAFSVSDLSSVAGAVQPGDSVDLLLTLSPGALPSTASRAVTTTAPLGSEGLPVTQIMLQNLLVMQVGPWTVGDSNAAPAGNIVTFAIDRQDALALKSAREQGGIDIVLRKSGDKQIVNLEPVTLQYLNKRFNFNLAPSPNAPPR